MCCCCSYAFDTLLVILYVVIFSPCSTRLKCPSFNCRARQIRAKRRKIPQFIWHVCTLFCFWWNPLLCFANICCVFVGIIWDGLNCFVIYINTDKVSYHKNLLLLNHQIFLLLCARLCRCKLSPYLSSLMPKPNLRACSVTIEM